MQNMRNPTLSQAALLFALTLTQLVCGGDKYSGSGCIEPPSSLSLVLPEVNGPLYLKDEPPYSSQSFNRISVGGALSLEIEAALGCRLDLDSIQSWWRSTENNIDFWRKTTCGHLSLGWLLLTTEKRVTIVRWLWWNIWAVIRGSDTKDPWWLWMSRLVWVAVQVGCLWTRDRTRFWVVSMAGVLSSWWMFDRPKLMAAPSSWWSLAEKLLLGLRPVGPPSGLGALVSFGLLLGSRLSSRAFSHEGLLFQPGAWKIDYGPDLFESRMNCGFLYPPSS